MYPVLVDFGSVPLGPFTIPLRIASYGLFFLLAILAGYWVVSRLGRRLVPGAPWGDFYFLSVLVGFVGAKLVNMLVFLPDVLAGRRPFSGMLLAGGVWLGGVIPAVLFALWFMRRHGMPPGETTNIVFVGMPLAHAIGRVGCLLGGCCYGARCDLPWAITYHDPLAQLFNGTPLNVPLHPAPVYEIAAELLNFGLALWYYRRPAPPFGVAALWLGLYGVQRFLIEFTRSDARGIWFGLSTSQWIALGMGVAAGVLALRISRPRRAGAPASP
jgi:phosphatidylglycerol:prolipoprotein diacylglycerol transferase